MNPYHRDTEFDAHMDYINEQQEKRKNRLEAGLCVECGDSPINPALSIEVCDDCFNSGELSCSVDGCLDRPEHNVRHETLCTAHTIKRIHQKYKSYIKLKMSIEEEKEKLDELKQVHDISEEDLTNPHRELTEQEHRVIEMSDEIALSEQELAHRKRVIQSFKEELDENIFHENYEVSF